MVDTRWSLSEHPVDAETARCGIIWQHERIRALLEQARSTADAAHAPQALCSVIAALQATMEAHFAYEERYWLPILRRDCALGRRRAAAFLAEHDQQREFVAALHHEASQSPPSPGLDECVTFLAAWLLAHMSEEERCLMVPDVLSDEFFVIAQDSG